MTGVKEEGAEAYDDGCVVRKATDGHVDQDADLWYEGAD